MKSFSDNFTVETDDETQISSLVEWKSSLEFLTLKCVHI